MSEHSILAVDDEPHMLLLLERIVREKTPYFIESCSNSLEVPGILKERSFDLIITDLKMPGMDGLDILRLVKEGNRGEEVIIITAFGSLDSAVAALSQGVYDYITKPFRKEQIISTLDRAMRWQSARRESARMVEIFDREPYREAEEAFQCEYVRRLAQRCGGDKEMMGARSGLSSQVISAMIEGDS